MAEYKTIEFTLSSSSWSGHGHVEITIEDTYNSSTNTSTLRVSNVAYKLDSLDGASVAIDGIIKINGSTVATLTNSFITESSSVYTNVAITSSSSVDVVHDSDGSLIITVEINKNSSAYAGFAGYPPNYTWATVSSTEQQMLIMDTRTVNKTLTVKYNGSTLFTKTVSANVPIVYNGSTLTSVPFSGGTITLNCSGCIMSGNIVISGKTLYCSGCIMNGTIVTTVS